MRRHNTPTGQTFYPGFVIVVLAALAIFFAAHLVTVGPPTAPVPHIDAENNVICYTYRDALACMAYHDEGTHLEILP